MIVVSGQSKRETTCTAYGLEGQLRQAGGHEARSFTWSALCPGMRSASMMRIRYEEKAWHMVVSGRPGPVLCVSQAADAFLSLGARFRYPVRV